MGKKVYILVEESWDEAHDGYSFDILTDVKILEVSMNRNLLQEELDSWVLEMGARPEYDGYASRPCAIMELRKIIEKDLVE